MNWVHVKSALLVLGLAVITAVPRRILRACAAQCVMSTSGFGAIVYSIV